MENKYIEQFYLNQIKQLEQRVEIAENLMNSYGVKNAQISGKIQAYTEMLHCKVDENHTKIPNVVLLDILHDSKNVSKIFSNYLGKCIEKETHKI